MNRTEARVGGGCGSHLSRPAAGALGPPGRVLGPVLRPQEAFLEGM